LAGLQSILPKLTAAGATVVGISTDEAPESRLLRKTLGLGFPLLFDEGAEIAAAYGVRMRGDTLAIPAVFVVTSDRRIVWRHVGENVPDRPTPQIVLDAVDGAVVQAR
jgi:peroxiredoxin